MRVAICGADADEFADVVPADEVCVDPADADLLVTVGEQALTDCAARGESRPIIPVGVESPLSPPRDQLAEILDRLPAQPPTVEVTPLSVTAGGTTTTAVFDVTLVTTEPARISEYAVSVGERRHAAFRADGVVVSTPIGSTGYGRAAGGPRLEPGTGLAVVPIAPFATHTDTWVLEPPLAVRVERDDSVTVFADTDQLAVGETSLTAEISTSPPLSVVETRRGRRSNWKNSNESSPHT